MESKYIKVGNLEINRENSKAFTKEQFIETFKKVVTTDINKVWDDLQKELYPNGSTEKPSEKSTKNKWKRSDEVVVEKPRIQSEDNSTES